MNTCLLFSIANVPQVDGAVIPGVGFPPPCHNSSFPSTRRGTFMSGRQRYGRRNGTCVVCGGIRGDHGKKKTFIQILIMNYDSSRIHSSSVYRNVTFPRWCTTCTD